MPVIRDGDYEIRYQVRGEGQVIVLLHGIFGTGDDWIRTGYPSLLSDYQLILIDLRGHGNSWKSYEPEDYKPYAQVADIKAVVDHLMLQDFWIWGYSYGGRIAFAFTIKYPNYVQKLIVGGMHPFPVTNVFGQIQNRMKIIKTGMKAWVDYIIDTGISLHPAEKEALLKNNHRALVAIDHSILSWEGFAEDLNIIASNEIPVILYLGDLDKSYLGKAELYRSKNPLTQLILIEDANHFSAFSDAKKVVSTLRHIYNILS